MNVTRKVPHIFIPRITLQSSGLVLFFAFGHTVSDAVTNMLSALLPTIQSRFGLSETVLALLVATLSLSALVTQPLFGALADRLGNRRIAALGVIFNAVLFSLIGIVPNISVLFGLILVGGLGSAALHPAMASMARRAGGSKGEIAVGLFSAGGTLGIAIGPILTMSLLANLGLSFTPWLMIPGILVGALLLVSAPGEAQPARTPAGKIFDLELITGPIGLLALTGILSNIAFITFTSAMPLWLVHEHDLPRNSTLIGWTLSVFSLAAAFGGIAGGMLSNKVGAKRLIVGSLLLALLPLNSVFSLQPGSAAYFTLVAMAGMLVNAGMPILIVSAQDLAPKSAATAAGMLMGFSAGMAGLVYIGIGWLQESVGLESAMAIGYLSLVAGAALAAVAIKPHSLPEEKPVEGLSCLCSPCMDQNVGALPQRIENR
ncbi:MAG TPA: MFS transporter [Anaerolineales bacterium]|nr:MFS transporter [Anaerolineales bacterium]